MKSLKYYNFVILLSRGKMIAVLYAIKQEINPIMEHMHVSKKFNVGDMLFYQADLDGLPVTLVQTGIGRNNAAKATDHLLQTFKINLLISSGVAGGIRPGVNLGDLVIAENVSYTKQSDFERGVLQLESSFSCKEGFVELAKKVSKDSDVVSHCGDLLTVDKVISQARTKKKIGENATFIAVDMESAAIAEVADKRGVEFAAVRSVSDTIEDNIDIDYADIMTDDGKVKYSNLAMNIMRNPRRLAILKRLHKQTKVAAKRLSFFMAQLIPSLYDKMLG